VLTGTVAAPADIEEASRLVQAFVGKDAQVVSRLKTSTPLQVMLRVRFSEVNRDLSKNIGFNILTRDNSGGFLFGVAQGRQGQISTVPGIPGSVGRRRSARRGAASRPRTGMRLRPARRGCWPTIRRSASARGRIGGTAMAGTAGGPRRPDGRT